MSIDSEVQLNDIIYFALTGCGFCKQFELNCSNIYHYDANPKC